MEEARMGESGHSHNLKRRKDAYNLRGGGERGTKAGKEDTMKKGSESFKTSRRDFIKLAGAGAGVATLRFGMLPEAAVSAAVTGAAEAGRPLPYRVGKWLPSDQDVLDRWLDHHIQAINANPKPLHPAVQEFKALIESDPQLYMFFHQMFEELPRTSQFHDTPMGKPQIRDYNHMLELISGIMTTAPTFNKTGLVGFPINAILDWPMGTPSGFAAFLNDKVNAQLKHILSAWSAFLSSPASRYVLDEDPESGWFGRDAMAAMPNFVAEFKCDPDQPYHGFASWDDFFTREFRDGQRPVAAPADDAVIVNACESAPYRIARNVKEYDRFWIKAQPYSLRHMFADDPVCEQFVGGTIYQAFLSALSYHRWHSPVSGTIVKAEVVDGAYYSETPTEGYDPAGPNDSQGYITEVATRAVVLIEADDPRIGLMCFMPVGMAEVSTCDITVYVGQHVDKGDPIGKFHFGGSTHCLIFRPETRLLFDLHGQQPGLQSSNIEVNAAIARVK
jgi:phosphatidylserine decarboxylase